MALDSFKDAITLIVLFGAIVGIANGLYTLCTTVFGRPKLKLILSDSLALVTLPNSVADRFHISCTFVNPSAKVAALHHLEAAISTPQGQDLRFLWNLFFEYAQGGEATTMATDVFPIAVLARSMAVHFVEFKLVEGQQISHWPQGRYEVNILGWANGRQRRSSPNIRASVRIEIDLMLSMALRDSGQNRSLSLRVPTLEWNVT
jgi:hypothetical protein